MQTRRPRPAVPGVTAGERSFPRPVPTLGPTQMILVSHTNTMEDIYFLDDNLGHRSLEPFDVRSFELSHEQGRPPVSSGNEGWRYCLFDVNLDRN